MARRPETQLSDLIEAAIEVFIAKGYRRTHMADVARAAGVSQGTLYNYVESKEALFYLILDRGFNRKPNRARSVPAAAGSSDRRAAASGNRRVVRASSAQHARFDDDHRRGGAPDDRRISSQRALSPSIPSSRKDCEEEARSGPE
jgi:AcrR family transcriptional regulator